jgi:hypothetical protein
MTNPGQELGPVPVVYPPVGGRLYKFAQKWESISPGNWVLSVVSRGYRIEFTDSPPTTALIRQTRLPVQVDRRQTLLEEVQSLKSKGAIVPIVPPYDEGGFWSTFFLAPKKTGDWRPILNLKPLNQFIKPTRFRMETLSSVLRCPIKGTWAASLDLKDAYLHIPIHPSHYKWLRFMVEGQAFQFICLPFGLSTAPRVFTLIAKAVAAYLKRKGINICIYLDDWLIYGSSKTEVLSATQTVVQEVRRLGFLVNIQKSNLVPSQLPVYLGAVLDLKRGRARPTQERISSLAQSATILSQQKQAPALLWLRVLGLMASMVDLVPLCRLHMRVIQIHFLEYFVPRRDKLSKVIPMSDLIRQELTWWMNTHNLSLGTEFPQRPVDVVISTDASNTGWGGHMNSLEAAGQWSDSERLAHINLLELWAVRNALQEFENQILNRKVLIQTDNTTVVAYINKQGGTRSSTLCAHAIKLIKWCLVRQIVLTAIHIPGLTNIHADSLSRGKSTSPTEWILAPQIAQTIFSRLYLPVVDLFATFRNKQLPVFCSRIRDNRALCIDALSMDWNGLTAYAFPPISLIHRVIQKITSEDCDVILIAPFWPKHIWFRPMVNLLTGPPLILPDIPELLRLPGGRTVDLGQDSALGVLKLTAWPLSGNAARRRDSLRGLRTSQPREEDSPLSELILSVWTFTSSGVPREIFLLPEHLPRK